MSRPKVRRKLRSSVSVCCRMNGSERSTRPISGSSTIHSSPDRPARGQEDLLARSRRASSLAALALLGRAEGSVRDTLAV